MKLQKLYTKLMLSLAISGSAAMAADDVFMPVFNGANLLGWKTEGDIKDHWIVKKKTILYDGKCAGEVKDLWTRKAYKNFILKVDWRFPKKDEPDWREVPYIDPDGSTPNGPDGKPKTVKIDYAGDSGIYVRGNSKSQINCWNWPIGSGEVYGYRMDQKMSPEVRRGVTPKVNADNPIGEWNTFEIKMVGDRLSVKLNGQMVLDNAQLPDVPESGPIALQHHGDPIHFRNILLKELD